MAIGQRDTAGPTITALVEWAERSAQPARSRGPLERRALDRRRDTRADRRAHAEHGPQAAARPGHTAPRSSGGPGDRARDPRGVPARPLMPAADISTVAAGDAGQRARAGAGRARRPGIAGAVASSRDADRPHRGRPAHPRADRSSSRARDGSPLSSSAACSTSVPTSRRTVPRICRRRSPPVSGCRLSRASRPARRRGIGGRQTTFGAPCGRPRRHQQRPARRAHRGAAPPPARGSDARQRRHQAAQAGFARGGRAGARVRGARPARPRRALLRAPRPHDVRARRLPRGRSPWRPSPVPGRRRSAHASPTRRPLPASRRSGQCSPPSEAGCLLPLGAWARIEDAECSVSCRARRRRGGPAGGRRRPDRTCRHPR